MDGTGYFMEPEQRGMESIFDKVQYQPQLLNQFPKELGGGDVPCGSEGKCAGKDAKMPLQWDFSLYRLQVVIVAVGQNDAHPDNFCGEDYEGERAACWRKRYADFLRRLGRIHSQAHIICMITILNHDGNWDRAIEEGTGVVIGEFGARIKNGNTQARTEFAAYYVARARHYGISVCWWDNNAFTGNGENFGLLRRANCTFAFPQIVAQMEYYSKTR